VDGWSGGDTSGVPVLITEWIEASTRILAIIVMAAGLFGTLIPFVPGLFIIWLAALGYGIVTGFGTLAWWMFGIMTVLMVVGSLGDNILAGAGAKQGGASWMALGIGFMAGVAGTIFIPPFGGLITAPLAVYVYEVYRQGSHQAAVQAIKGMLAGYGISFAARFAVGLLMILCWLIWVWQG
jgi:uncharacterized protein